MSEPPSPAPLTHETFHLGVGRLAAQDECLAGVVVSYGCPPFWTHEPGFPGLVLGILAQQVSVESARAALFKLEATIGTVSPEGLLSLDDQALRAIGFSRQKASYARGLAERVLAGHLDLPALAFMSDEDARRILLAVRGIGAWTADTYLLFALRRPDAWPSRDLALIQAIQETRGLAALTWGEADRIAERWRPLRAVAARILWHAYLSRRGRKASE